MEISPGAISMAYQNVTNASWDRMFDSGVAKYIV
jgi:hypothetical protein